MVVHVFLIRNDKLLLLRIKDINNEYFNHYSVISDYLERNETINQAAVRSIKKIVGIDIEPESLSMKGLIRRKNAEENNIEFFFECSKWSGKIINNNPEKYKNFRWVSINDLPISTIPYIKTAFENFGNDFEFYDID